MNFLLFKFFTYHLSLLPTSHSTSSCKVGLRHCGEFVLTTDKYFVKFQLILSRLNSASGREKALEIKIIRISTD